MLVVRRLVRDIRTERPKSRPQFVAMGFERLRTFLIGT